MAQALPKLLTFDEFIEWYPEHSESRYELHDGVIIEMPPPVGKHEEVLGFLAIELALQIRQSRLPYFIPKTAIVKPPKKTSGYSPDVVLLNSLNLSNEKLWEKSSTVSLAESVPLVVEVVSSNWEDDYYAKFGNYETMGISEYWIADYAALGAKKFTGNPKQPTLSICQLVDGEYQVIQFRNDDRIVSPTFPELNLTTNQIFQVSGQR